MSDNLRYMKLALNLAIKSDPYPNPRVGAVLVKDGIIIGKGYHRKAGHPHAEIEAMKDAAARRKEISGSILYVTLEPCSHTVKRTAPCTKAIVDSGISRVVFAMNDPNPLVRGRGKSELEAAGIKVAGPVGWAVEKAQKLNKKYIELVSEKPYVTMKMAMSLDGKTATRTGDSKWISCRQSRKFVYRMRSECDAIIIGASTVAIDDPQLTTHGLGKSKEPYRIIVDGKLKIPIKAKLINNPDGKTIVATSLRATARKVAGLKKKGVPVIIAGSDDVDLKGLITGLGMMGMKKIMIEGGSELNAKAVEAGIVNRICIFVAPKLIGGNEAKPVVGGIGIETMNEALGLKNMKTRKIGCDVLITADLAGTK